MTGVQTCALPILPGMSGFAGELMVFLGFANSPIYSTEFKTVIIFLAAVGLILTPVYLLSMMREMFYGQEGEAVDGQVFLDAKPRELFIAAALMVPIVAIGLYPKLLTETYDATTVNIAQHARNALPIVAQNRSLSPVSMVPTLEPSVLK